MAKGRRPKPTSLRVIEGNPGKRKIANDEPKPLAGVPPMPDQLHGDAAEEWERVAPLLAKVKILTHADRAALACYCHAWGRWCEATKRMDKDGMVAETSGGFSHPSAWVAIAERASKEMRAYEGELGLTPAARSRLHIKPPDDDGDPKAKATLDLID